MSRRKLINRAFFDFSPMQSLGKFIYSISRDRDVPEQSTATKFFRNLEQLAALEGPLANAVDASRMSALVVGCSIGCEAFTLAGHLSLFHPNLDYRIDACDISDDALKIARAGIYGPQHGLGIREDPRIQQLERCLVRRDGEHFSIVEEIRERVRFYKADVLAPDFTRHSGYDLVFGQNFMIHMCDEEAERAFSALTQALRPGGVLFVGGMDLDTKSRLVNSCELTPLDWNLQAIHDADDMRRSAWPWTYWSLEPIDSKAIPFLSRYATIFLKAPARRDPT